MLISGRFSRMRRDSPQKNTVDSVWRIRFAVGSSIFNCEPAQPLVKLHWGCNERMNWPFGKLTTRVCILPRFALFLPEFQ